MKTYGIEIIGTGARARYCVKEIMRGRGTNPVDGKAYRTEQAAREAAQRLGLTVDRVGDFYSLIS